MLSRMEQLESPLSDYNYGSFTLYKKIDQIIAKSKVNNLCPLPLLSVRNNSISRRGFSLPTKSRNSICPRLMKASLKPIVLLTAPRVRVMRVKDARFYNPFGVYSKEHRVKRMHEQYAYAERLYINELDL